MKLLRLNPSAVGQSPTRVGVWSATPLVTASPVLGMPVIGAGRTNPSPIDWRQVRILTTSAPTVVIAPTPRYDAAALVDAIAAFVGEKDFNCRELKDHAMVVEGPLRDAIGTRSPKQLGKALWAIKEKDFDGYYIERLGADKHGAIWRLRSR